jgi:hypothetical protein
MKKKINLKNIEPTKVFDKYVYPVFAKEFLLMNNYGQFANAVSLFFILTGDQWNVILNEWESKEQILTD